MAALQLRSIREEDTAVAVRLVGTVGAVLSFAAVTVTFAAVCVLPAPSRATAESVCEPFATARESQETA